MFLRSNEPDVLKYIANFLRKDKDIADTGCAHNVEHERLRQAIHDISNQFFVQTATWGLISWEEILGIRVNTNDSYEMRRNRIYLKLQSHQVSTKNFMIDLINRHTNDDSGFLIEYNQENWFEYGVNIDSVEYWGELMNAIDIYKPAHLGCYFVLQILHQIKIGCSVQVTGIVDARHCIWNLGEIKRAYWNGEFPADGTIRGNTIQPDARYRERQQHSISLDTYTDAKQCRRWYNIADGSVIADGSHFANGSRLAELVEQAISFATIKNNIESEAIPG